MTDHKRIAKGYILVVDVGRTNEVRRENLVQESQVEDNEGKRYALQHGRRGRLCWYGHRCADIVSCTFIHMKKVGVKEENSASSSNGSHHPPSNSNERNTRHNRRPTPNSHATSSHTSYPSSTTPMRASAASQECIVCYTDCNPESFRCTQGHSICHECLSQFIVKTWKTREVLPGATPVLPCCADGCSAVVSRFDVVKCASDQAANVYLDAVQRARDASTFANAQKLINKVVKEGNSQAAERASNELLQRQLREQLPNALMCPKCKFGPVDSYACPDLNAHQGQLVSSNGTRINNSCPKCGFFTANRQGWEQWDGVLRNTSTTSTSQSSTATATSSVRLPAATTSAVSLTRTGGGSSSGVSQGQGQRPYAGNFAPAAIATSVHQTLEMNRAEQIRTDEILARQLQLEESNAGRQRAYNMHNLEEPTTTTTAPTPWQTGGRLVSNLNPSPVVAVSAAAAVGNLSSGQQQQQQQSRGFPVERHAYAATRGSSSRSESTCIVS